MCGTLLRKESCKEKSQPCSTTSDTIATIFQTSKENQGHFMETAGMWIDRSSTYSPKLDPQKLGRILRFKNIYRSKVGNASLLVKRHAFIVWPPGWDIPYQPENVHAVLFHYIRVSWTVVWIRMIQVCNIIVQDFHLYFQSKNIHLHLHNPQDTISSIERSWINPKSVLFLFQSFLFRGAVVFQINVLKFGAGLFQSWHQQVGTQQNLRFHFLRESTESDCEGSRVLRNSPISIHRVPQHSRFMKDY